MRFARVSAVLSCFSTASTSMRQFACAFPCLGADGSLGRRRRQANVRLPRRGGGSSAEGRLPSTRVKPATPTFTQCSVTANPAGNCSCPPPTTHPPPLINIQMTLTKLCCSFCVYVSSTGGSAALLSGTLKTYHKTVCDSENVTLSCPRGTSISIEMAQYEKNEDGKWGAGCGLTLSHANMWNICTTETCMLRMHAYSPRSCASVGMLMSSIFLCVCVCGLCVLN